MELLLHLFIIKGEFRLAMNENSLKKVNNASSSPDYTEIVQSASFQKLLKQKRNFILPLSVFLAFILPCPS